MAPLWDGRIEVWPEEPVRRDGTVTAAFAVEGLGSERKRLWYRFPEAHERALTDSGDPYVLALLFSAMRRRRDLHVHGYVSPSLLAGLEEFQAAWVCWRPSHYVRVGVSADAEREAPVAESDAAITLFSGGVDSSFSAIRHRRGPEGRATRRVAAGLMAHGFDVPLANEGGFRRAAEKAARIVESLGMDFIPMTTNLRELETPWWDFHGAAGASCLTLLRRGFRAGLIPSTEPYDGLVLPWGTNPVTDWMMSSDSFPIVHDGAGFSRMQKVEALARWPEALQNLRVCLEGNKGREDENCNACEKCIRTVLAFRVLGVGLPSAFSHDVSVGQILGLRRLDAMKISELQRILDKAHATAVGAPWVRALALSVRRNRAGLGLRRGREELGRRLRSVARGVAEASGIRRRHTAPAH